MRGFTASSMKHLIIPTPSLVSPVPTNAEDFQSVVQEMVPTLWWQRARLRGQGTQKGRNGEFINTWPQGWVSPRSDTQLPSHDSSVSSQTLLFSRPSLDFYLRTLSLLIFKALSLDNPSEQMDLPTAHLWKLIQDLTSKVRPWSDKKKTVSAHTVHPQFHVPYQLFPGMKHSLHMLYSVMCRRHQGTKWLSDSSILFVHFKCLEMVWWIF